MASKLMYYSKDPNGLGRGAGFYYNRTWRKKGYNSNYKSKYSATRDFKYAGRNFVGGVRTMAHTTDKHDKAGSLLIKRKNQTKLNKYLGNESTLTKKQRIKLEREIKDDLRKYIEPKTHKYKVKRKSKYSYKKNKK